MTHKSPTPQKMIDQAAIILHKIGFCLTASLFFVPLALIQYIRLRAYFFKQRKAKKQNEATEEPEGH